MKTTVILESKKVVPAIIISIFCFLAAIRRIFPPECKGLVEAIWVIIFGSLALLSLTTYTVYDLYTSIRNNLKFNLLPFISFSASLIIIAAIIYMRSERFKSPRTLTASNSALTLILRQNNTYELTRRAVDFSCTENGSYQIQNDTIYLAEVPGLYKTQFINERFFIDRDNQMVISLPSRSMKEEERSLCIE